MPLQGVSKRLFDLQFPHKWAQEPIQLRRETMKGLNIENSNVSEFQSPDDEMFCTQITSIICIQTASILILWAICVFNHQSCNRFFFQLLCSLMKYFGVLRKDSGGNGRLFDWMVYQLADPLFFSLQATLSAEESLLMRGHVPSWGSTTSSFLPQIHTEALFIFINRLNDAYI